MNKLNEPMQPERLDPARHDRMAGDWSDDDGPALDQYFEAPTHEPLSHDTIPTPEAKTRIPEVTRLLNRSIVLFSPDGVNAGDPVMLLPADPNRKVLILHVSLGGSATGIRMGSARSDVYGAPLYAANATFGYNLSGHTGAIWCWNPSTAVADTATVSITTVTS